jgi:hypothetical protein
VFAEQVAPVLFVPAFGFGQFQQDGSFFAVAAAGQVPVDGRFGTFVGQIPAPKSDVRLDGGAWLDWAGPSREGLMVALLLIMDRRRDGSGQLYGKLTEGLARPKPAGLMQDQVDCRANRAGQYVDRPPRRSMTGLPDNLEIPRQAVELLPFAASIIAWRVPKVPATGG